MTSSNEDDEQHLFDGHGEYEHKAPTKAQIRVGVAAFGAILIFAVIGGMFLY